MKILEVLSNKYFKIGILIALLAFLAATPYITRPYTMIMFSSIMMYVILTVSWTIFSGYTGYISLASAAFFGVGIYVAAVWGGEWPILLVLLFAGVLGFALAAGVGVITLRLRDVYFTIFTLGLIEFVRRVVLWWEINQTGTRGRYVFSLERQEVFYYMLVVTILLVLVTFLIKRSRFGIALTNIGECEEAAAHVGINVTMVKVLAFSISAFFMSSAGAIMATRWSYIDPYMAFNPDHSFFPVLMAIFGGMSNLAGPVIGAVVFASLRELLITRFPHQYMLVFGIIMVVTIMYLPEGLTGLFRRMIGLFRKMTGLASK